MVHLLTFFHRLQERMAAEAKRLANTRVQPEAPVAMAAAAKSGQPLTKVVSLEEILRRSHVHYPCAPSLPPPQMHTREHKPPPEPIMRTWHCLVSTSALDYQQRVHSTPVRIGRSSSVCLPSAHERRLPASSFLECSGDLCGMRCSCSMAPWPRRALCECLGIPLLHAVAPFSEHRASHWDRGRKSALRVVQAAD